MNIYCKQKQFSPRTGQELSPAWNIDNTRVVCDYTGLIIDYKDYDNKPSFNIDISYDDGCEADWEMDELSENLISLIDFDKITCNKFDILCALNVTKYHFAPDKSFLLVSEWIRNYSEKDSVFYQVNDVARAFRVARYRMAEKLLKDKVLSKEELLGDVLC